MGQVILGARAVDTETIRARALKAAAGFTGLGIGAGDTVAVYLRNDVAFFEAATAAGILGAYSVPVNWHYTEAEAAYLLRDCAARVVVIHADLLAPVRGAIPEGVTILAVATPPEIASAYGVDPARAAVPPGVLDWDAWVEAQSPFTGTPAEAPGAMIYTSGTTGHPKGVKRHPPTPAEAQSSLASLSYIFGYGLDPARHAEIVMVVTGPMYHSAPNAHGGIALRIGATVILQPRFDPEDLLALIDRHRVTHLHLVPTMFVRLLRLPEETRARYDLSSLRVVVHAAAPCPAHVKRAMIDWFGPIINEYYGGTETGGVTFCTSEEWLSHPGTVGRAIPNARVVVLDGEGREAGPGVTGEVYCRQTKSADFTYQGDDEKRRRAEWNGLISLGDIGYLDDDGFLHLCDRAKDMVISGGVNIYPAEIEAELHKMPGLADCAVFGIPDEEFGESLCAVIQPRAGVVLTAAEVASFLRPRVAGYKVPRRIEFAETLPREDTGKIFKRKLREPYWAAAGRAI